MVLAQGLSWFGRHGVDQGCRDLGLAGSGGSEMAHPHDCGQETLVSPRASMMLLECPHNMAAGFPHSK